ncbi:MAG: Rieske (2Fe-2S) protein [Solibacterales bacterium]|nr:Rieske (2Fe-2S) protein [Bryobacterales bacterium]|tara:strand:- start:11630 stop:12241 length:612 start_codon:yes stop_codon:yes gene_type:complete
MADITGESGKDPDPAEASETEVGDGGPSLVGRFSRALQTSPDKKEAIKSRRRLVGILTGGFLFTNFLMFLRFFFPRTIFEPRTIFRIGAPADFGIGVDTKFQKNRRIWVVKTTDRMFVIFARCTHLGCTPDWKQGEQKFKCPCHGSGFDPEGINYEGPAPRPLDRATVSLDPEGQIVVNTATLFKWEKGKQSQFNDPGAFLVI